MYAQLLPFETIDFKDTEFENAGTTLVYEDRDGFLWIEAYGSGLIRYDGKNIENFFGVVNLSSKIYDLYQDEYGYMWVLGVDGSAQFPVLNISNRPVGRDLISDTLFFKNRQFNTQLLSNKNVHIDARFSISQDNKVLIYSDSILVQYHYAHEAKLVADTLYSIGDEQDVRKILGAMYLLDGSIIFTTLGYENMMMHAEIHDGELVVTNKYNMGLDVDLHVFKFYEAGQNNGIWASDDKGIVFIPNARKPNKESFINIALKGKVEDLITLEDKTMLVSTKGHGLFEINKETFEVKKQYEANHGLKNAMIFSLNAGHDHVWLATSAGPVGLAKDYRAFAAYNSSYLTEEKPFLKMDGVNATGAKIKLKNDLRDFIAVCTGAGMVLFNEAGEHILLDESNGLSSSVIAGVCADDNGRIWVSPVEGGVDCIFPRGERLASFKNIRNINLFGHEYSITHVDGYNVYIPKVITMKSKDTDKPSQEVFIGANGYMIQILVDDERWLNIEKMSGYKSSTGMIFIDQDQAGFLYFGNSNGLMRTAQPFTREYYYQIKDSGRVHKKLKTVYTSEKIIDEIPLTWKDSIFQNINGMLIQDEEIWVSVNSGVLVLSTNDLKSIVFIPAYETANLAARVPQSLAYSDGSVWGGTGRGGLLEYDAASYKLMRHVSSGDGLLNDRIYGPSDLSISDNGILNYGTAEGLVRYNPRLNKPDTSSVSVLVRDYVFTDNRWGKNELQMSYIGLTYDEAKTMRYKTRLKGFDEDWSQASSQTDIRYTNLFAFLFPKIYEFEVMAADYRDRWSQSKTSFPIKVYPPIWSSWWSVLFCILLLTFVVRKYLHWKLEQQKKEIALQEAKIIKEQKEIIELKNEENELLLKEIHHRVKNNLQTISSLLSLQSETITDQSALNAVKESKNRVASMALIHQKLYQRDNLAAIEMRDYFETIGRAIIDSFGDRAAHINIDVQMTDMELDVDSAIPIGLITNELVTNSLKYAFDKQEKGQISISLSPVDNDMLKLEIADDGLGQANSETNSSTSGFGTMLVQLLTTQLRGQLQKSTENGTSVIILFSKPEKAVA